MPGFDGEFCETLTRLSFKGNSYVSVDSDRDEGYKLSFRFQTTLPNTFLAIGLGHGGIFFTLWLQDGRLKLHSSMLREFDGITIGQNLTNRLQEVTIEIKTLNTLSLNLNNQLIARGNIALDELSQTAFKSTFLGGLPSQSKSRVLVGPNSDFIGKNYHCKCMFFMSFFQVACKTSLSMESK